MAYRRSLPHRLGRDMTSKGRYKGIQTGHTGHGRKSSCAFCRGWRSENGSGRVELLLNQTLAENFIPLKVRRTLELFKDGEMRRSILYCFSREWRIFNKYQPSHERSRLLPESTLTICRPKIKGRSDRFLGTVVTIISERPDLTLELDGRYKMALVHDEQIPLLSWPEVSW